MELPNVAPSICYGTKTQNNKDYQADKFSSTEIRDLTYADSRGEDVNTITLRSVVFGTAQNTSSGQAEHVTCGKPGLLVNGSGIA